MKRIRIRRVVLNVLLTLAFGFAFSYGIFSNTDFSLHDFALGLSTEFLGLVFTVTLLEMYLNEKRGVNPQAQKHLRDHEIRSFLSGIARMYHAACLACCPEEELSDTARLFSPGVFRKLMERLRLTDTNDAHHPKITWASYFDIESRRAENTGLRILDRHAQIIDRKTLDALCRLLYDGRLLCGMRDIAALSETLGADGTLGDCMRCPDAAELEEMARLCAQHGLTGLAGAAEHAPASVSH